MNDIFAQQSAQTPSPSTGSRQATQSVGRAMFSASFAACDHTPRQALATPWKCEEMERDREGTASMAGQANVAPVCAQAARRAQDLGSRRATVLPEKLTMASYEVGATCVDLTMKPDHHA
jgi:hypothetical protein